jgi:hypothetical protein
VWPASPRHLSRRSDASVSLAGSTTNTAQSHEWHRSVFWTERDFTGWEIDEEKFQRSLERLVLALRADDYARITPLQQKL